MQAWLDVWKLIKEHVVKNELDTNIYSLQKKKKNTHENVAKSKRKFRLMGTVNETGDITRWEMPIKFWKHKSKWMNGYRFNRSLEYKEEIQEAAIQLRRRILKISKIAGIRYLWSQENWFKDY